MTYMGSKSKYASVIVPIIQKYIDENNINTYIEPFVGGANIIDKIKCKNKFGYDKNYSLIELHKKAQSNFDDIPAHGSPEWWYEAKEIYKKNQGLPAEDEMEGWRIGAIAFFASFSNGGFTRGYGKNTEKRDYYNEAYRNLRLQSESPLYKDIHFEWNTYDKIEIPDNSLVYCDPPYKGTKPYGYKFEIDFDYEYYYNWLRDISKNNIVICSEQEMPDDFNIIWEKDVKRTVIKDNNFKAQERLYIKGDKLNGIVQ